MPGNVQLNAHSPACPCTENSGRVLYRRNEAFSTARHERFFAEQRRCEMAATPEGQNRRIVGQRRKPKFMVFNTRRMTCGHVEDGDTLYEQGRCCKLENECFQAWRHTCFDKKIRRDKKALPEKRERSSRQEGRIRPYMPLFHFSVLSIDDIVVILV